MCELWPVVGVSWGLTAIHMDSVLERLGRRLSILVVVVTDCSPLKYTLHDPEKTPFTHIIRFGLKAAKDLS